MFASWKDAATAVAVVAIANLIVNLLAGARDGLLAVDTAAARLGYRRGEPPEHARDLWFTVVGQRVEDSKRRRRALVLVLAAAAGTQALSLNGYVAGGLIFGIWLFLDIATRAYGKLLYGLAADEVQTTKDMSVPRELAQILSYVLAPTTTNPLRGRWRPLGIATGIISMGLAAIGWIALLSAFGVAFNGIANVAGRLMGTDRSGLVGIVGAVAILVARAPNDLARRLALAHPDSARHYDIVFLRSFQDDGLTIRARGESRGIVDRLTMRHRHGYEQLLVASMQHFGPVVAIGEPGEQLPPTGAFRLYYEDDQWQEAVAQMLRAAKFVVLSLGETLSVGWEISKLKDMRILNHTLFLIPPVDHPARQRRLQLLARHLEIDPALLEQPEPGVDYVGVMFEHNRPVPIASAAHDYASYYAAILEAGLPHFERSVEDAKVISIHAHTGTTTPTAFARTSAAALQLASAQRNGWPLNTFQILCALVDTDRAGPWRDALINAADFVTDDYQLYLDRPADIAGHWAEVPLTAHATDALRTAAGLSERYRLEEVPPEALVLALVTDPTSAASEVLLQTSNLSHAELIDLLARELHVNAADSS